MNQDEFNDWSKSAYEKGVEIANDEDILEKYKKLFTPNLTAKHAEKSQRTLR